MGSHQQIVAAILGDTVLTVALYYVGRRGYDTLAVWWHQRVTSRYRAVIDAAKPPPDPELDRLRKDNAHLAAQLWKQEMANMRRKGGWGVKGRYVKDSPFDDWVITGDS